MLADREFCSVQLAQWLKQQGFSFALRLRSNEYIQTVTVNPFSQLSVLKALPQGHAERGMMAQSAAKHTEQRIEMKKPDVLEAARKFQ